MKIATLATAAVAIALLTGCGTESTPETAPSNVAAPARDKAVQDAGTRDKAPGPPVTDASIAAASAYVQSEEAKAALAGPAPQVAGVAKPALDNAAELAVCRIAFAVKHGDRPHAPSDVELRQSAFDLASNPKALEECRARP
jgi:hypothetical protein